MEKQPQAHIGKSCLPREEPPWYSSHQLFGGSREVHIEHAGQQYRLRITRQNKLILTK